MLEVANWLAKILSAGSTIVNIPAEPNVCFVPGADESSTLAKSGKFNTAAVLLFLEYVLKASHSSTVKTTF